MNKPNANDHVPTWAQTTIASCPNDPEELMAHCLKAEATAATIQAELTKLDNLAATTAAQLVVGAGHPACPLTERIDGRNEAERNAQLHILLDKALGADRLDKRLALQRRLGYTQALANLYLRRLQLAQQVSALDEEPPTQPQPVIVSLSADASDAIAAPLSAIADSLRSVSQQLSRR